MKTLTLTYIALIGALSLSLFGCKKGAEDPFLSMKSRQNRIAGEWEMADLNGTAEYGESSDNLTNAYTFSFSEGMLTENNTTTGESMEFPYKWEFTFDKDGNFSRKIDESFENHVEYYLSKGGYTFMDKNKSADIKKGQFISLIENEFTGVYNDDEYQETVTASTSGLRFELIRLTDDEMIVKWVDNSQFLIEVHEDNSKETEYRHFELELKFTKK